MATVKSEKTYFGGKAFTMRVNVASDGIFRIKLPVHAIEALSVDVIEKATLTEAVKEFERLSRNYANMLTVDRKVIRYCFRLQDKTHRHVPKEGERDDIGFGIGKGLQFGVVNMIETAHKDSDGDVKRRSYKPATDDPYPAGYGYGQFDSIGSCEAHTVDWTIEREAWFLGFCDALDTLIAKTKELDEDKSKLLEAVDNQLLLSATPYIERSRT